MKIGVIISSNDAETCWNALRYANFSVGQKDEVKVFFMGKGVEYQKISTDKFNTIEQAEKFMQLGGKVYACGTCIKSREQEATGHANVLPEADGLHRIADESDFVADPGGQHNCGNRCRRGVN